VVNTLIVSRIVAVDLCDYWNQVDINSDDSEFALDNPETIGGVRDAWLILERAMNEQSKALLLVELETAGTEALFEEAKNRLDIARDQMKELHPTVEAGQHRKARAMVRAYQRLLRQK
jgi:hypothetical protein